MSTMTFDIKNVFQPQIPQISQISGINPQNYIENLSNNGNDLSNIYYNKDDGNILMKKINKLNMNFYMLSERYLKNKNDLEQINDNLFLTLFKQISIFIEEIEKLNIKIKEKGNNDKLIKGNVTDLNKEIINYKLQIKNLEKELNEKKLNEKKLKSEIDSYKRRISFYQEKLKLDMENKKKSESKSKNLRNIIESCGKTTNNSSEKESLSSTDNNHNSNTTLNLNPSHPKTLTERVSSQKKSINKYSTRSNLTRREFLKRNMRGAKIKSNNISFIDKINFMNTSKFSVENDDKLNRSQRLEINSISPKKIEKKKTISYHHSIEKNLDNNINTYNKRNVNNNKNNNSNNNINNNLFNKELENIFKDVNSDYEKNIKMLNEEEQQIKEMLNFIKGNKILVKKNKVENENKKEKNEKDKKSKYKKNKTQNKLLNSKLTINEEKEKDTNSDIYLKTSEI